MSFASVLYAIRKLNSTKEKTLVACSAGVDSVTLAYILHRARVPLVLGHVAHNIRAPQETEQDIQTVKDLAILLGVEFRCQSLTGLIGRNLESRARSARYDALRSMSSDCPLVATAHHADDHFVTAVMQLARGSRPVGIRPRAEIFGLTVIRPMLVLDKQQVRGLADKHGLSFHTDSTNTDHRFVRNGFNAELLPLVERYYPSGSRTAVKSAWPELFPTPCS